MRAFSICFALAGAMLLSPSATAETIAGQPSPRQLLEQTIRRFFEPESSCTIEVRARSAAEELQGRFSSLALKAQDASVKGMRIQSAAIAIGDFAVDLPLLRGAGKIRVFSANELRYRMAVTETSINWLLSGNRKLSREAPPRLELGKGTVLLSGHLRTDLFNSPFQLRGRLAPRRGKEVHFVPDTVSIGWLTLPGFLMDVVAGRLNPVATLDKLMELERCNLQVRDVVVTPGLVTVSG